MTLSKDKKSEFFDSVDMTKASLHVHCTRIFLGFDNISISMWKFY